MMSEATNEDRMYPIEMTLQGARCCISIGKGVIKALGKPSPKRVVKDFLIKFTKKPQKKCQKQILAPDTFADGLFSPA